MTGLYQATTDVTGRTDLPQWERDQFIGPSFLSYIKFCKKWGYKAQASPIASGTVLRNYCQTGTGVTINGTPTYSGGMMVLSSTSTIGLLGNEWKLASTVSWFAVGGFFKIPMSGYTVSGTGTGSSFIIGWTQTNGGNTQYGIRINYNKATGVASNVYLSMNAVQVDITSVIPTDGAAHQYAAEMQKITDTTFLIKFYVDAALVYTSSAQTWSGSLVVPGGGAPMLGPYYAAAATDEKGAIGEAWIWNVGASTKYSDVISFLKLNYAAYASRYS